MKRKLLILLMCAVGISAYAATELKIVPMSGAETAYSVAVIGKLVPNGSNIELWSHTGTLLATEPVANIRRIVFCESAGTSVSNTDAAVVSVYPNPTDDILMVKGIENQVLRVFDMQGHLIKQVEGAEVNVSDMASGTYLLQIGTQVVRFIKQ